MTGGRFSATNAANLTGQKTPVGASSTVPLSPAKANRSPATQFDLSFGTGSGQADILVDQFRTLLGGASEDLDLYDGTTNTPDLVDVFDVAVAIRKIKFIRIEMVANSSGTPSTGLVIGNATTNANALWFGAANDTQALESGGVPFSAGSAAGKTVSNVLRNVKITNSDPTNTLTYRVTIAGTSV